jgi:hypothetical protein
VIRQCELAIGSTENAMIHISTCIFADREGNRDPQLLLRHMQRSSSTQEPIGGLRPGHFLWEELW